MRKWMKVLPLFIVIWLARSRYEKFSIQGRQWHLVFEDVLICEIERPRGK